MDLKFPTFETNFFKLRQFKKADITPVFSGLSNPDVIKYYGVNYHTLEETNEQMEWYKKLETTKTGIWWAITDIENTTFYGAIGLNNLMAAHKKAEIGFWLMPNYWGKGIMKEAAEIVCNYAFKQLHLHRIEALVEMGNDKSIKLLQKLGFNYEGTLIDFEIKNGNYISLASYAKFH